MRLSLVLCNAHQAARMGPMVCKLDGPAPIVYRSKWLVVTNAIVDSDPIRQRSFMLEQSAES